MGEASVCTEPEGTIPRTNNYIEQFFRKRSGNIATWRYLSLNIDRMAIFQNIAIPEYVRLVFHSGNISASIEKYRKSKSKNNILRKTVLELIDKGKKYLISGKLKKGPYSEELKKEAYAKQR